MGFVGAAYLHTPAGQRLHALDHQIVVQPQHIQAMSRLRIGMVDQDHIAFVQYPSIESPLTDITERSRASACR